MAGGLMNLVSYGNNNIILNGNPKKTFFKSVYQKYTNFGLQRFRINHEGNKILNTTSSTFYTFKIPRYAELLHDSYLVINLPNIYSPFHYIKKNNNYQLIPYEFKWIQELGVQIIKKISIVAGGATLSEYDGEYLSCLVQRDYSTEKKELWNKMIGNIPELNNPGNAFGNINTYPNAQFSDINRSVQPSIRNRKLYIPLETFFCQSSKLSLPLIALQYQEIFINIELRPVVEWYTINNIDAIDFANGISYHMQPNYNVSHQQLWKFLQEPTDEFSLDENYNQTINDWNSDVHLNCTYIFLSNDERRLFAAKEHKILIKNIHKYDYYDVGGPKNINVESKNMVSSYMFRFRRNDAYLRNEWNNYTNWAYKNIKPVPISIFNGFKKADDIVANVDNFYITGNIGINDDDTYDYNEKYILKEMGIIIDGVYRENIMDSGVYNYIEKFKRNSGNAIDGLYFYNFCLNSNKKTYQPSGAINLTKFKHLTFEYDTIDFPIDPSGIFTELMCDGDNNLIGFRKNTGKNHKYNFDLKIYEERYNVIVISSGNIGLLNAR